MPDNINSNPDNTVDTNNNFCDNDIIIDDMGDDFSEHENFNTSEPLTRASRLQQVSEKKSPKAKKNTKKLLIPISIVIGVILLFFIVLYVIGIVTLPKDRVMNNVYVGEYNLSGLTYEETLNKLNDSYLKHNQNIVLTCNNSSYTINGNDIGMLPKPVDTAKKAFNYGKSGNVLADGFKNGMNLIKKHVMIPVAEIDKKLLADKVKEFGINLYGELQKHSVEFDDVNKIATIIPGKSGYDTEDEDKTKKICDDIIKAIKKDSYNIRLSLAKTAPKDLTIADFDAMVYSDPVDAKFEVVDNNVNIIPEQPGRYIDKDKIKPILSSVREGGKNITVSYELSLPNITAKALEEKLFSTKLASYSTNYGGSTYNRKANVARSAELINNKILAPGEIFSYNDTVGKRTVSNGFHTATEYVGGKSVQGIGGGTCQVSTTLYCAALYADMQIVSRTSHAMTVAYVPLGQDATVADGSIDFKFKNSSEYPVKIVTSANGSTITVSIWGTQWEPEKKIDIKHSTSYIGEDTSVQSTRYVYSNGELLRKDSLGKSYYKPHKAEETPAPTPDETPVPTESTETEAPLESDDSSETSQPEDEPSQSTNADVQAEEAVTDNEISEEIIE